MNTGQIFIHYFPKMLEGAWLSLKLLCFSALIGLIIAIPLGILRSSRYNFIKALPYSYIFFFRSTPLILQLAFFYYGLAQFEVVRNSFLWVYIDSPYYCALITMSLHTSAYIAEILRGAIYSIPMGEIEAAIAHGFSYGQLIRRIVLPRATRIALPAYSNEVILMLKASAVVYTITLYDLIGMAKTIAARNYEPMVMYVYAGIFYLLITVVLTYLFRQVEQKLKVSYMYNT